MGIPRVAHPTADSLAAFEVVKRERTLAEIPLRGGRVVIAIRMAECSDAEQQVFSDRIVKIIGGQVGPFAVIMDMRALRSYPPTHREIYAKAREKLRPVYGNHALTAYVVDSDIQKGFVTAVGWKAAAAATSGRTFTRDWRSAFALCTQKLFEGDAESEPEEHVSGKIRISS
jgi:hypothetical protein